MWLHTQTVILEIVVLLSEVLGVDRREAVRSPSVHLTGTEDRPSMAVAGESLCSGEVKEADHRDPETSACSGVVPVGSDRLVLAAGGQMILQGTVRAARSFVGIEQDEEESQGGYRRCCSDTSSFEVRPKEGVCSGCLSTEKA